MIKVSVRYYENENGVLKTGEELHAEHNSNGNDCECDVCVAYSTIMHIPCLLTIYEGNIFEDLKRLRNQNE